MHVNIPRLKIPGRQNSANDIRGVSATKIRPPVSRFVAITVFYNTDLEVAAPRAGGDSPNMGGVSSKKLRTVGCMAGSQAATASIDARRRASSRDLAAFRCAEFWHYTGALADVEQALRLLPTAPNEQAIRRGLGWAGRRDQTRARRYRVSFIGCMTSSQLASTRPIWCANGRRFQ